MGKVATGATVSLDGYMASPNETGKPLTRRSRAGSAARRRHA